ncbi:hypothetical protein TrRE_jg13490, partial [Triparma retinervis]
FWDIRSNWVRTAIRIIN